MWTGSLDLTKWAQVVISKMRVVDFKVQGIGTGGVLQLFTAFGRGSCKAASVTSFQISNEKNIFQSPKVEGM